MGASGVCCLAQCSARGDASYAKNGNGQRQTFAGCCAAERDCTFGTISRACCAKPRSPSSPAARSAGKGIQGERRLPGRWIPFPTCCAGRRG